MENSVFALASIVHIVILAPARGGAVTLMIPRTGPSVAIRPSTNRSTMMPKKKTTTLRADAVRRPLLVVTCFAC